MSAKIPALTLSSCDACRQSKARCTGGHPCLTCQWHRKPCNYSPGGRLGRPRGSKNKQNLMQQMMSLNREQQCQIQGGTNRCSNTGLAGSGNQHQQQQQQQQQQVGQSEPDFVELEFDLEQTINTTTASGENESSVWNCYGDLVPDMMQLLSAAEDSGLGHQFAFTQVLSARQPTQ